MYIEFIKVINEVIIIKKNEEIKLARQSKERIAKLICKRIVEEISL